MSNIARLPRRTLILASAVLAGIVLPVAGSAAASSTAASPTAGTASSTCGVATLRGTYLFAGDGWSVGSSGTVPLAFAGSERFDGAGQVRGISSTSFNGVASSRNAFTGTYTVAANCTATLTISGNLHFDLYLDPSGDSFVYVQTDPGSVSATTENRATRR